MAAPIELIGYALTLTPAAFVHYAQPSSGPALAIGILLLGGLSHAIGQSVALFAHRTQPWRFTLSLATGAVVFAASIVIWCAALAVATHYLLQRDVPLDQVIRVVGLAHAPRLLSFFTFTPYFGSGIGVLLTLWTYLAVAIGARAAFGLERVETLVILGAAWFLSEAIARLIGRPLIAGVRQVVRRRRAAPPSATKP